MSASKGQSTLPEELLWEGEHASELALTSLADGESALLSVKVRAHVDACDACLQSLGEAALLSSGLGRALHEMTPLMRLSPVPQAARRRMPLPLPAIAIALVVAIVGAAPTALRFPTRLADVVLALLHMLPAVSRSGAHLLQSGLGPAWVAVTFVAAALLAMLGVGITRLLPHPTSR